MVIGSLTMVKDSQDTREMLPDQKTIFPLAELLDLGKIGIALTENGAMYPQASVCGLYIASRHSKYFVIK